MLIEQRLIDGARRYQGVLDDIDDDLCPDQYGRAYADIKEPMPRLVYLFRLALGSDEFEADEYESEDRDDRADRDGDVDDVGENRRNGGGLQRVADRVLRALDGGGKNGLKGKRRACETRLGRKMIVRLFSCYFPVKKVR